MAEVDPAADRLAENLEAVRDRIRDAERQAGRSAGSVELLPVSKYHPVEAIAVLAGLGVALVGENREQEAREKALRLRESGGVACGIAMIGQIQTKKANSVARWASEVHSLDSVKLAHALERGVALAIERHEREAGELPCLVQVSADGDTRRGGVSSEGVHEVIAAVEASEHLSLRGFMVVPPLVADPEEVFTQVRGLVDTTSQSLGRPLKLSAGMSGDFEQAIACGSDIVRVGTAVFGQRPVV